MIPCESRGDSHRLPPLAGRPACQSRTSRIARGRSLLPALSFLFLVGIAAVACFTSDSLAWIPAPFAALLGSKFASQSTPKADLEAKIAELEAERDLWKGRAETPRQFPATAWPIAGRGRRARPFARFDESKPLESFLAVGDRLIDDICADLSERFRVPVVEVAWVRRMLEMNVKGGKMNRGLGVLNTSLSIFRETLGQEVSNHDIVRMAILGWCVEFLQTSFLIADDIMDASKTRRGQQCWYRREDVQMIAINDALLLEMLVYRVLKMHFASEAFYGQLVDLFLDTTFQTELGQLMDIQTQNLQLADLSIDRWSSICSYKTAMYSFYMPVALGMIIAGIKDEQEFTIVREIMLAMGIYFQAQDDFLDAFASPEQLGKIGTDIQDKKCSWLFVNAYPNLASSSQRAVFDEHYGTCKAQSREEKLVKNVYHELGMDQRFKLFESETMKQIDQHRASLKQLPWSVVSGFFAKIYKRVK